MYRITWLNYFSFIFPLTQARELCVQIFLVEVFLLCLLHRDIPSVKRRPCITNAFDLHVSSGVQLSDRLDSYRAYIR